MVDLVDDWEVLKEHSSYCKTVLYRIDDSEKGKRIRIRVGRFAFDNTVDKEELDEILSWLGVVNAVRVVGSVSDDMFFA